MQDAIILYENGKAIGGEGHPTDAGDITFDNTGTDLISENVEDAIVEVNANSAKSADLTSIFESGTTASQVISAGTYFYLNGTLVRAKIYIASGATFTLNTNYEVVTAGALNEIDHFKDIKGIPANGSINTLISDELSAGYVPAFAIIKTTTQLTGTSASVVISALTNNRYFALYILYGGSAPTMATIGSSEVIRIYFKKA